MNFFNENNIIFVALNKIGDIILANLLFILCSIPLVTIGPSLTALYHCMLRTVKGNNNGTVKTFFRAFRQSFRQSLIVWLGLVVVGLLLFLDTRFLLQTGSDTGKIFYYLSGIVLARCLHPSVNFLTWIAATVFPDCLWITEKNL